MKEEVTKNDHLNGALTRRSNIEITSPPARMPSSIPDPVIYNGTMMENLGQDAPFDSGAKKRAARKISTFNLMLILVGSAVVIVLYISNVIKISQLLAEINRLEVQHTHIMML